MEKVRIYEQSCVQLWFETRFGEPSTPLGSTDEALSRFVAPFGLEDVFAMTIRPNPNRPLAKGWARIIENARGRWPELTVMEP